ncbi:hypothetical protein, partial [Sutterella wadsworthensis]|uniref:hypothetical protein n=1 Tax=Sutterella wadsworthensis TaxID=40545 RepID=UPI0019CF6903
VILLKTNKINGHESGEMRMGTSEGKMRNYPSSKQGEVTVGILYFGLNSSVCIEYLNRRD